MADGLTPGYLRRRARYWRERAAKATDREKQIRLRQTAEILKREAEARALERRENGIGKDAHGSRASQPAGIDWHTRPRPLPLLTCSAASNSALDAAVGWPAAAPGNSCERLPTAAEARAMIELAMKGCCGTRALWGLTLFV
jgi:hypothetical protein